MSKLDDILTLLVEPSDTPHGERLAELIPLHKAEFKKQFKDLMLELVGVDENKTFNNATKSGIFRNAMVESQNLLRSELRNKVNEL